jgi:outer membrane immunogenic protein
MKKIFLIGSALSAIVLGTTSTLAADFAPPASTFDWNGVYVGGYLGYINFDSEILGASNSFDGVNIGGIIGANYQMDQFVLGVEGDLGWTNADGSFTAPVVHTQEVDLNYALRARAGYAIDNTLLFLQGGVAFAEFKAKQGAATILDDTLVGFQVGAGLEHAFTEHVTVRLDGLYTNYGKSDNITLAPAGFDVEDWRARIGVSYLF